MNLFDKSHRLAKIFSRLSLLSIPLASAPLFISLFKATTLPSSQVASQPVTSSRPSSTVSAESEQWERQLTRRSLVAANFSSSGPSSTISAESEQWERQLTRRSLVAANSSTTKISNQKLPTQKLQKHLAKAKTHHKRKSAVAHQYTPPKVQIRVAIAKDVKTLAVGSSTSAEIRDRSGRLLRKLPANQGFYAQINGSALMLDSWKLPEVIWIESTRGGYIYINDRWYRGRILLASQGSKLLAVNDVGLDTYLYSVVGSEMSASSPPEALKAQAIAARSYALVHLVRPASAWYNLGNTERWQVYKGLDSEFDTTRQAVDETAGMILSYQGGIVESLYAASDEIVAKAHGGRGMSQQGAYKLATQGHNYQQILGTYYPGTSLARLAPQVRTK